MTNWQRILRDNDPGLERMNADAAQRMRHTVVRAAAAADRSRAVWPMRVALAAFACVVVMISVAGTQRATPVAPERVTPLAGTERRQIQFATPGGTRIIWELNPKFSLMETLP